jgi:hypothetical protein
MSDAKKLHKFTHGSLINLSVTKVNPNYVKTALDQSQPQQAQPLINLPSKPKSLLESI